MKALIAVNLDQAIIASGMTNRAVARAIETDEMRASESQVWRWRRGRHMPSLEALIALAGLFFDGDVSAFYTDHEKAAA